MEIIKTNFEGLFLVKHKVFEDQRGLFIKTYNQTVFNELGIDLEIKERYFSVSQKNVIRGMHFQTPPEDHIKLVNVMQGSILDVVIDIRQNSETFGQYFSIELKASDGKTIYIPKGFAHGFMALENNTVVEYNQTTEYAPNNDAGIRYDSFGFDWNTKNPVISSRDLDFETFQNFKTPFK
jgi:dTDP-4-dehydrorhamnose 3,5-epimerase/CDP-3, 6-dideoxy-D-glycero-D-glycero-4-hexulose-5-epimerase